MFFNPPFLCFVLHRDFYKMNTILKIIEYAPLNVHHL
jgi:hypothetical protein